MNKEKIRKYSNVQFLEDLKTVNEVMVRAGKSKSYLRITKRDIREEAEFKHIYYHFTDKVFKNKRVVMIIE